VLSTAVVVLSCDCEKVTLKQSVTIHIINNNETLCLIYYNLHAFVLFGTCNAIGSKRRKLM